MQGCRYVITDNVLVSAGTLLSIAPDVTVLVNGDKYIMVDGTFTALGGSGSPITFTINPGTGSGIWGGVHITDKTNGSSVIKHVIFEHAGKEINETDYRAVWIDNTGATIEHVTLRSNPQPMMLWSAPGYTITLRSSRVTNNLGPVWVAGDGYTLVDNTDFLGNNPGDWVSGVIRVCGGNTIRASTFADNRSVAILLNDCAMDGPYRIEHNTIRGNHGAIAGTGDEPAQINHNEITENTQVDIGWPPGFEDTQAAIALRRDLGPDTFVNSNNLRGNSTMYAVRVIGSDEFEIDATDNWWGTTDETAIEEMIYDYWDDFTLPRVVFEPFATDPFPVP